MVPATRLLLAVTLTTVVKYAKPSPHNSRKLDNGTLAGVEPVTRRFLLSRCPRYIERSEPTSCRGRLGKKAEVTVICERPVTLVRSGARVYDFDLTLCHRRVSLEDGSLLLRGASVTRDEIVTGEGGEQVKLKLPINCEYRKSDRRQHSCRIKARF